MTMPATVLVMVPLTAMVDGVVQHYYPGQKVDKLTNPNFSTVWDQYHTTYEVMQYASDTYTDAAISQIESSRLQGGDPKDHAILLALAVIRDLD